jgi:aminoglycoside phosphotransferase family enzyme/predicted kinase
MNTESVASASETHLSRLFVTPDRVFKLLKPVTLPFVDFSDTEQRCAAATEEFERNRAISPDVYLGLADVREHGELTDRMVVMRRLPADRELRYLLGTGPQPELIRQTARHIASMHAGLAPLHGPAAAPASLDAIATNWEDNFEVIQAHLGSVIEPDEFHELAALARAYMAGRGELFQQRIDDGWVRDGHGDLRAEHIYCLSDGPRLIDCVAFDDRLRISDSLADVAFLAMDLDRLAGPGAAVSLMSAWNEFTNEHHPSSLAHFYVAYRAHVRCKIACLRHAGRQPSAAATARAYHDVARRHIEHARIRLVLVGGGPGSGKSTIAENVANYLGAAWLRSDEVRKDVAGVTHDEHAFAEPDEGLYSPAITARTFAELNRQADTLLRRGVSVVLDATWRSAEDRAAMRTLASQSASRLTELRCVLPASLAKERIVRRMASLHNPSDASPDLVGYIAERFDDWIEATPIDTSRTVQESIDAAHRALTPQMAEVVTRPAAPARFSIDLASLRRAVLIRGGLVEGN